MRVVVVYLLLGRRGLWLYRLHMCIWCRGGRFWKYCLYKLKIKVVESVLPCGLPWVMVEREDCAVDVCRDWVRFVK